MEHVARERLGVALEYGGQELEGVHHEGSRHGYFSLLFADFRDFW